MGSFIDLTGKRFGKWVVLHRSGSDPQNRPMWEAVCDCGKTQRVPGWNLRSGHSRSCGHVQPTEDLFWKYVKKGPVTDCWMWGGAVFNDGYGQFHIGSGRYGQKPIRAHRYSWMLHVGEILNGLQVLHKCDKPLCVNPAHLFLGTHADNMADMVAKGRHNHGENHSRAKVTAEQVIEIRRLSKENVPLRQIAPLYNISAVQVGNIASGRQWKHL